MVRGFPGRGDREVDGLEAFGELRADVRPQGGPFVELAGLRAVLVEEGEHPAFWLRVRARATPGSAPSLVGDRTTRWRSRSPGTRGRSLAECGRCSRSEGSRRAGRVRRRPRRSCRRPGGPWPSASVDLDSHRGCSRRCLTDHRHAASADRVRVVLRQPGMIALWIRLCLAGAQGRSLSIAGVRRGAARVESGRWGVRSAAEGSCRWACGRPPARGGRAW